MNGILCVSLALFGLGQEAGPLQGEIAALEPLLGSWEVNAEWGDGRSLWSRASYEPGVGGRSIQARVFVRDEGGVVYQRYFTVFSFDVERGSFVAHSFQRDGSVKFQVFDYDGAVLTSEWTEGESIFRDATDLSQPGVLGWVVSGKRAGANDFTTMMNAQWRKDPMQTRSIDTTRIAAGGKDVRSFVKTATIQAPRADVYAAWSDGDVFPRAYDPDRPELSANIDLVIGGRYEWLWDGKLGSNGCQVLSYIPGRMISFTWNAPPTQPESRAKYTWVVVEFADTEDGGTKLTLTHLGFGTEAHWDETFEYFSKAWPHVLEQFKTTLETRGG